MRSWNVVLIFGSALCVEACAPRVAYVSGGDCILHDPPATGVWIDVDGRTAVANDLDLARHYPERALRRKMIGQAKLHCAGQACEVSSQGTAEASCKTADCWNWGGEAADDGFGAAAETVAHLSGLVLAARPVDITLTFKIIGPGRGRQ